MKKASILAILLILPLCANMFVSCDGLNLGGTHDDETDQAPKASEGLTFVSNGDGTCYVAQIGSCTDSDIIIPSVSDSGDTVTGIGDYAFAECDVTTLTIPEGVTYIGESAFFACEKLKSVAIPNSVTEIGMSAFEFCTKMSSVEIGSGLSIIGDWAFSNCNSMTAINVNENNPAYCSIDGNLYTKNGETLVYYAIGKSAESFTVPEGVKIIGEGAFERCQSLIEIKLPNSTTNISDAAFASCTSLVSVEMSDSVTNIGIYAFSDCSSLEKITIPDSVTNIGWYAFNGCDDLTSATFENPNGWWYSSVHNAASGDSISSNNLADESTAAEYLRSNHVEHYLFRD